MEQAADRLGTTQRFVRRLVAERRIPYLKIGRHVRISEDDVEEFISIARIEANPSRPRTSRRT
jgi:excisionase family DNA binding protein